MPESILTLCQSRLYPPGWDQEFGLSLHADLNKPALLKIYETEIQQTEEI